MGADSGPAQGYAGPHTGASAASEEEERLTPLGRLLLHGLREGQSWLQLAAERGLMPGEVYTELIVVVALDLAVWDGSEFHAVQQPPA
ncbi:MAG: hypothetical protein ACHQ4H_04700 [Ktedonobacterales bacterium]